MDTTVHEFKKGDKKALAYEVIRDHIMKGSFAPNCPLTEKELSGLFDNLSRTPIRDALLRLEHEGLVERIPGKGLFVTQINIADLLEITEIRLSLECTAVRLFVERADDKMRQQLREVLESHKKCHVEGNDLDAVTYDNAFHYAIAKGSMNNRLYDYIHKLIQESYRGAFMTRYDSKRIETSIKQHERVLEAIEANDAERAVELVSEHLIHWIEYVKDMQFSNYYLFNR